MSHEMQASRGPAATEGCFNLHFAISYFAEFAMDCRWDLQIAETGDANCRWASQILLQGCEVLARRLYYRLTQM